jgi:MerR family transcriptional regulator, light-induced transcriptional regulator
MSFCLEGETHFLGLKMVAALFGEHGCNVRNYGTSLPLEYACIGGNNWKPDLIGVSVSIVYHLPKLKEYMDWCS